MGTCFASLLVAGVVLAAPAQADPVNHDRQGLGLHGFDPVAYFERGEAIEGSADHTASWGGVTYRFENADRVATFQADPDRYLPRYGGFCAYAMASGKRVDIDPRAFAIVEGRLYLNYSRRVQRNWEEDRAGLIQRADAEWERLTSE